MSNLINIEMEERITDEVYNDDSLGMTQMLLAVKVAFNLPTLDLARMKIVEQRVYQWRKDNE